MMTHQGGTSCRWMVSSGYPGGFGGLSRGERPFMATTMGSGPLDELVALHNELGVFDALDQLPVVRQRAGIADPLLFRTSGHPSFPQGIRVDPAARLLFQEPAILLQVGWAPVQIQAGDNDRHRHPEGRQAESLPCHPDTLRDAFRRVAARAWEAVQKATVGPLFQRQLVRARLRNRWQRAGQRSPPRLLGLRLGTAADHRRLAIAGGGRLGEGQRSCGDQGVDRTGVGTGGPECIELLLVDALYADGPLLAWLAYAKGIDVLTPLPSDRLMVGNLLGMAQPRGCSIGRGIGTCERFKATSRMQTVEVAAAGDLTSWESFVEAARELWGGEAQPVGLSDSGDRPGGTAAGKGHGVGQHATVGQRLCGVAGVSATLAHRE